MWRPTSSRSDPPTAAQYSVTSVPRKCRLIARRDRYHWLEFGSAFGAVPDLGRWHAVGQSGPLCPATRVRLLARHATSRSVPRYRFEISWSVPTYRLDWIVLGYSGVATGAFWDSCWWLRVGTVHACPLVPHSLSYSASHRHFTTFGLWSRVGHRSARLVPHSLTQRSLV